MARLGKDLLVVIIDKYFLIPQVGSGVQLV